MHFHSEGQEENRRNCRVAAKAPAAGNAFPESPAVSEIPAKRIMAHNVQGDINVHARPFFPDFFNEKVVFVHADCILPHRASDAPVYDAPGGHHHEILLGLYLDPFAF